MGWWITFLSLLKYKNHLVQHDIQHHSNVLLSSVYLNGHTLGFDPHTESKTQLEWDNKWNQKAVL